MTEEQNVEQLDFDGDVEINPDALDVEWVRQPGLIAKYARLEAEARTRYNTAKDRLAIVEAQLYLAAKEELEDAGLKSTDAACQAWVASHHKREAAVRDMQHAAKDMAAYGAALRALDHKKDALTNLVRLLMADYFSAPVDAPRNLSESVEREHHRRSAKERARTKEAAVGAMHRAQPRRRS